MRHLRKLTARSGDGARAKQLSEQGKQHQANQQRLDGQASDWIFRGA